MDKALTILVIVGIAAAFGLGFVFGLVIAPGISSNDSADPTETPTPSKPRTCPLDEYPCRTSSTP